MQPPTRHQRGCGSVACASGREIYPGRYGAWSIEKEDLIEVWSYRVSLTVAATALLLGTAAMVGGPEGAPLLRENLNAIAIAGAGGVGVALQLIHIYMSNLKRLLQVLWLSGTLGGLYLMTTHRELPLPLFVAEHNWAVWFVGPLFAAVTGLTFKEGVCYGKPESALLFAAFPILLLGHLTALMPADAEAGCAVGIAALFALFAARKYTQPVKDDIGDKSVFVFSAMSPEQQRQTILLMQRNLQQGEGTADKGNSETAGQANGSERGHQ